MSIFSKSKSAKFDIYIDDDQLLAADYFMSRDWKTIYILTPTSEKRLFTGWKKLRIIELG